MDQNTNNFKISWQTSLVLDIFRLSAALYVYFYHGFHIWFDNKFAEQLSHFSVVVFFVLSGYVIAYSTSKNNRGALQYAKARLGKLYSILLPAIIITAICQLLVYYINKDVFSEYNRPPVFIRYILSIFYLNEVWSFSAAPLMNIPLWSLSYEFWYYVIFGTWFYFVKSWKSYLFLLLPMSIAGPSILLMMPIWILGCLAYKIPQSIIRFKCSWILFLISISVSFIVLKNLPPIPFRLGSAPFFYANEFVKDFVIGLCLAIGLASITKSSTAKRQPLFIKTFRKIADFTFPVYLLHYPIFVLWKSIVPVEKGNASQLLLALGVVLVIIIIIGIYLDRMRTMWDSVFDYLLKLAKKYFLRIGQAKGIRSRLYTTKKV